MSIAKDDRARAARTREALNQVLLAPDVILEGLPDAVVAATRVMKDLLFGVSATDPLTFGAVALLLGMVTLDASYVPALRATKVDPIVALRYE